MFMKSSFFIRPRQHQMRNDGKPLHRLHRVEQTSLDRLTPDRPITSSRHLCQGSQLQNPGERQSAGCRAMVDYSRTSWAALTRGAGTEVGDRVITPHTQA